jgi:RES domain-containing protein
LKAGGRYNPPEEFGAVYSSLSDSTAIAEVTRGLERRGIDPGAYEASRWWVYEVDVALTAVLDLTDAAVLERLKLKTDQLTAPDVKLTRELAAAARAGGFQGLIVPSAALPTGKNVVVFPDTLEQSPTVLNSRPVRFSTEKSD